MNPWKEEVVYHDGDRFFSDLCQALSSAKSTIDLETFIFDRDRLGTQVLKCLTDAAKRGVRVRLLLDGFGCSKWSYLDMVELKKQGVDGRFYHPWPWQNPHYQLWRSLTLRRILLGVWKLNRRNHRKTCVIDGESAFLGGMNITARHLSGDSSTPAWRDTSIQVRGREVFRLTQSFEIAWTHSRSAYPSWHSSKRLLVRPSSIRLNLTRKQRTTAYKDLIQRIYTAKSRVWITNAYFVPDLSLIRALRYAAWSGLDVQVLVPRKSTVFGLKWASMAFYLPLLAAKVRIFEYAPAFLHAKTVLIDDWAIVGSSNLNHRSLIHDLEVDIVLSKPESLRSLESQFCYDLSLAVEINPLKWAQRRGRAQLLERLALVFRHWM